MPTAKNQSKKPKITKSSISRSLKTFLNNNPYSSIQAKKSSKTCGWVIKKPWNDDTLEIQIPADPKERRKTFTLLNKIILPDQLTAIYHIKSKQLEVIWTAYKLSKVSQSILGRSFKFQFEGIQHLCEFKDSSSSLVPLSERAYPNTAPSDTNYRNMQSFWRLTDKSPVADKPVSFWISNAPSDNVALVRLIRNLNFYIKYYDTESPTVLIHPPSLGDSPDVTRFRTGKYPKSIKGKPIDENLLVFWNPPVGADNIIKYLHYYKILEYCAHMYVEDIVRAKVKRLISRPDAMDDIDKLMQDVLSNLSASTMDPHTRAKKLLRESVDASLVWVEICNNRQFFEKTQKFDGGFETKKPLISDSCDENNFTNNRLEAFYYIAKEIRNSLSHGNDIETLGSILPTKTNEQLLKPWVNLLEIVAGEVILNRN